MPIRLQYTGCYTAPVGSRTRKAGFVVSPADTTTPQSFTCRPRPRAAMRAVDAMAAVIRQTDSQVKGDVLIVVLTDGLENASRECTKQQLNTLIKAQEAKGWNFLYLGVAPDAWLNEEAFAGTAMADNTTQSTGSRGLRASFYAAAGHTVAYAAAAPMARVSLSAEEKRRVRRASN